MSKPHLLVAALAALLTTATGSAGDAPAGIDAPALFKQLDGNSDGVLAEDEIPQDKRSLFERLVRLGDGNADGKLSADEFAAGLAGGKKRPAAAGPTSPNGPAKAKPRRPGKAERPGPGRLFARLDANQDGKVEIDEVPAEGRDRFAKLVERNDKDGDGALSQDEFVTDNPVRNASTTRPLADRDPAEVFKFIDRNGDGKVEADEAPEARREGLARMIERGDKDGDNALSLEEFTAIAKRVRAAQAQQSAAKPQAAKKKNPKRPSAAKTAKKAKQKGGQVAAMPAGLFGALDADRDGKLDSDEISAASSVILKLDKDGDGSVSVREVAATAKNKKKKDK